MMNSHRHSVLMFPWLAHGHISPYLELARKLADRDFIVYLCSTSATLHPIKKKIETFSGLIQVVELNLPTSELASEYHTTNGLPLELMSTLKEAFNKAIPEFFKILKKLRPDLLIYDFLQPWAPAAASALDIPAVEFITSSAAMIAFYFHELKKPGLEFPFPNLYYRDYEIVQRNRLLEGMPREKIVETRNSFEECFVRSSEIVLMKSCKGTEEKYFDYLSDLFGKKVVSVGPLVQEPTLKDEDSGAVLRWLNQKPKSSTVFVAFGSEYFLKKEDIEEIAGGLEISKANFIWVLRFPNGSNIELEEALPKGFFQRVGERGKVVQGWAPQAKILNHCAIGGFVSHCGWSSVMESMKFGVPIIAMPMHLDQPINARLVQEVGVGLEVARDENGRIQREEIAAVINQMLDERSGKSVREKAQELRTEIQYNGEKEIDGAAEELIKLCVQKKKKSAVFPSFLNLNANFSSFFAFSFVNFNRFGW